MKNTARRVQLWVRVLSGLSFAGALILGTLALTELRQSSVIVEWSTASELDTSGFNLLRSEQADGEYVQVNEQLIPPSSDPLIGGDYFYTDHDVKPGHKYYYFLEDIDQSGNRVRHGPIEVKAGFGGISKLAWSIALIGIGAASIVWLRPKLKDAQESGSGDAGIL